jgi:hypothetical protein
MNAARKALLPVLPLQFHYCLDRLDRRLSRMPTRLAGAKLVYPQFYANLNFTEFFGTCLAAC